MSESSRWCNRLFQVCEVYSRMRLNVWVQGQELIKVTESSLTHFTTIHLGIQAGITQAGIIDYVCVCL